VNNSSTSWCSPHLSSEPLCEPRRPWVVVDLETTGLDPSRDAITELAAVVLDSDLHLVARYQWCTADGFRALQTLASTLAPHIREGVFVAHNAAFDLAFLRGSPDRGTADLADAPRWLCTLNLVARRLSLQRLAERLNVTVRSAHTAAGDSDALSLVLARLVAVARSRGFTTVAGLAVVAPIQRREEAADAFSSPQPFAIDDVRALLDTVVPIPPISKRQWAAFAEVGHLPSAESAAQHLRTAGVSVAALDVLLEDSRYLEAQSADSAAGDH
jgi:DNA polymerase III epsilon subunit-like protein